MRILPCLSLSILYSFTAASVNWLDEYALLPKYEAYNPFADGLLQIFNVRARTGLTKCKMFQELLDTVFPTCKKNKKFACEFWEFPTHEDAKDCQNDSRCKCLMELNVTDTEFSNVFNEIMIVMVGEDIWDELERMITADGDCRVGACNRVLVFSNNTDNLLRFDTTEIQRKTTPKPTTTTKADEKILNLKSNDENDSLGQGPIVVLPEKITPQIEIFSPTTLSTAEQKSSQNSLITNQAIIYEVESSGDFSGSGDKNMRDRDTTQESFIS